MYRILSSPAVLTLRRSLTFGKQLSSIVCQHTTPHVAATSNTTRDAVAATATSTALICGFIIPTNNECSSNPRRLFSTGSDDGENSVPTSTDDDDGGGGGGGEDPESKIFAYQSINAGNMTPEEIAEILREETRLLEEEEDARIVKNWKPGMRKRPLVRSIRESDFEPKEDEWTLRDKRSGALGIKVGMMPVFDDKWGIRYPCTVLYLDENIVIGNKTKEQHGYSAIQVGAGNRKRKNVGKCVLGQYKSILHSSDEHPPYLMREFRINADCAIPIGSRIHASHFVPGQNVDVSGKTCGKGFQGGMKRHGFGGMPASHGTSLSHRHIGSTGQCQDPGKVFKGKKMPGRMGGVRVTTQNLRIIKIDRGRNLLYVQGSIPGKSGNFVEIRDAVKKPLWNTKYVVGGIDRPPLPTSEYDDFDGCGEGGHEVFMPMTEIDPSAPDNEATAA